MPERLVDVERQGLEVLHTFPVTLSPPADEGAFKQKALEAAGHAQLVPNEELESLTAKMHVSRGGRLTPYGDPLGVLAETKAGLDQFVRDRAYFLWDEAGRPGGRADDFWRSAASALPRTRLRSVGAGGPSRRQGGRALVSDARLRGELMRRARPKLESSRHRRGRVSGIRTLSYTFRASQSNCAVSVGVDRERSRNRNRKRMQGSPALRSSTSSLRRHDGGGSVREPPWSRRP